MNEAEPAAFTDCISIVNLGRSEYTSCWDLQRQIVELRTAGRFPDTLVLTEHDHVYTIGRTGNSDHLLAGEEELRQKGIALYHNDRGGDITYHGPGQLVGYPILDLSKYYLDLHRYLRDIEEVIMRTLASYAVTGNRIPGHTGVWVGQEKICAIGIKTTHWITMHGFALNVNTDLSFFERIIPCGIFEKGVTSLQELLGTAVDLREIASRVGREFGTVFGAKVREIPAEEFMSSLMRCQGQMRSGRPHHQSTIESI
jgi:lipoyl(octanoyl) transferase